jgi:enoyl-CoA hydratase
LVDLIAAADKPVIAAINGLCMGGGFELSLACDLRIAGRDVESIGLPETRIGIFPGGGGTQRLPRVIGEAKALEMILRGLTVGGPAAGDLGLVHEVVDDPLARALEIAAELATRGAEGLAYAKRLTRAALDRPLAEGLADERQSFGAVMRTASAREGLRAGRPPAQIQSA